MEFFRHCPGCGRRFHIKLETKKLVTSHEESIRRFDPVAEAVRPHAVAPVTMIEGKPLLLDIEEFQYVYKCGHCGHEWSEKHLEEHKVG